MMARLRAAYRNLFGNDATESPDDDGYPNFGDETPEDVFSCPDTQPTLPGALDSLPLREEKT